jgi:hypothetical protein
MAMTEMIDPRSKWAIGEARLTGFLYLLYFLSALPLGLRAQLIVPADAAATAGRILASQDMYRLTLVTDLLSYVLYIGLVYLFYRLLKAVSPRWAAVGALFAMVGCIVLIMATALVTAPLLLLADPGAHAIGLPERQELALLALKLFGQAYTIALFLFGAQWLVMGPLFTRLVPRPIGWLLTLGGVAWVALSVATLLALPMAKSLQAVVLPLGALAEIALGLWLLVKGAGAEP